MNFKFVSTYKTKGPVVSLMLQEGTVFAAISRKQPGDLPEIGILSVGGKSRRKSTGVTQGKAKTKIGSRVDDVVSIKNEGKSSGSKGML